VGTMTDNAGLRGFSRALSRRVDDHVINTLRDVADKCAATHRPRPPLTVTLRAIHRYDYYEYLHLVPTTTL